MVSSSPGHRKPEGRILGIDFTSAPRPGKPLVCARALVQGGELRVLGYRELYHLDAFGALLGQPGPWIAGLDFPFGLPRRLIENIGWPRSWVAYVAHIGAMGRTGFEGSLEDYRRPRPAGDKQHLRVTDRLTGARSPMMLHRVPVGKMFFEGSQKLLRSTVNVLPCRPTNDDRTVVETYPALLARHLAGKNPYKSDTPGDDDHKKFSIRQNILSALPRYVEEQLGLELRYARNARRAALRDARGDYLDALLCAVTATWAWTRHRQGYGIPANADPLEGWIVNIVPSETGVSPA